MNRILGHEKEEAELAGALRSGRIFPTWIFHGLFGVGKAGIAFKFAKCLLADVIPERNALDVDEGNPIHKLVDLRTHPDFFILEQTEESVSIDEVRKLLLKVQKTPALSKRRVVILENASSLNKNIYNSLLKMLEEPPKDTVVVMICSNAGMIPQTLLSRSAKLYFRPLEESTVKRVLDDMGVKNSEKLARLSEGSVGYALRLSENNGIEIYENILRGFASDSWPKALKWIVDNKICERFEIVKTSFLRILKIYVDILNGVASDGFDDEAKILSPIAASKNPKDREIKKVQEIIYGVNICEPALLDKTAAVANAFERFFTETA
ncbi:MAG: hypothetical protein LBL99_01650 [Holosporaceae bacterium]|jgi:DNA polymerase-3 subunit delta'|nr:hypothetical protein [Holosporaceae bacterium]